MIEVCDHIFIFAGVQIADENQTQQFGESKVLKVSEDKKYRKYCEICEKNFSAAVYTFKNTNVPNVHRQAIFLCSECYTAHVTEADDEDFEAEIYKYLYHKSSKYHGIHLYK